MESMVRPWGSGGWSGSKLGARNQRPGQLWSARLSGRLAGYAIIANDRLGGVGGAGEGGNLYGGRDG